mgnify:CR=1 FL=1
MPDQFIDFLEQEYRKIQTGSMKGRACPYKPILCQEGYCSECAIYQTYLDRRPLMSIEKKGIPELLLEADKLLRRK